MKRMKFRARTFVILVFGFLAGTSNTLSNTTTSDSFIVDDVVVEPPQRKLLQLSQNIGSMALGFTPRRKKVVAEEFKKHIAPSISLEKSLKHLDVLGDKRQTILPSLISSQSKNKTLNKIERTMDNNTATQTKRNSTTPTLQKKNVLTDSTVLGFFARNPNFTISDIGTQGNKGEKKDKQEEGEKKNGVDVSNRYNETIHLVDVSEEHTRANKNKKNTTTTTTNPSVKLSHEGGLLVAPKTQLHLVNPNDFLRLPVETTLMDFDKQANAVKKGEIDHSSYLEEECNEKKECPKNKYCRHFHCYEGHRKHHECHEDDQCIDGMFCIYGRCDDKKKGSPGTICEKDEDCGEGCCVIEPTITTDHGLCKSKLKEFHQCAPVLFRKVWIGEKPKCGPCEDGLECLERGVISSHLVCIKKK